MYCKQVGKDSLYLKIPKTLESRELDVHYKIVKGRTGSKVIKESSKLSKKIEIQTPLYAARTVIAADVIRICGVMKYDPELVLYYNENNVYLGYGKSGIVTYDFLETTVRKNLREKELNLLALLYQMHELGPSIELRMFAEEIGLLDGYTKILEVMEM